MIKWFKTLYRIVKTYDEEVELFNRRLVAAISIIKNSEDLIKDRTNIHVDISPHFKSDHQIIVIGRYRNHDYIQTYSLRGEDIRGLINQLKEMQQYGILKRIDCPISMRAIVERDLKRE